MVLEGVGKPVDVDLTGVVNFCNVFDNPASGAPASFLRLCFIYQASSLITALGFTGSFLTVVQPISDTRRSLPSRSMVENLICHVAVILEKCDVNQPHEVGDLLLWSVLLLAKFHKHAARINTQYGIACSLFCS